MTIDPATVEIINDMVKVPEPPTIDTEKIGNILNLWQFSDQASEVTGFFQQLFSRLPPYFLAFFALCLLFVVVPLIIRLATEIL